MDETHPDWTIKPLSSETWPAFEQLAAKHNGVWGGCWCTAFHSNTGRLSKEESNHDYKQRLTKTGKAHAALVFEGDQAIAWCQFGSPTELPDICHKKTYQTLVIQPPDYRITCLFVDKDYRKQGVAQVAVGGALDLIAESGGGVVEASPQETRSEKTSSGFLYNGTTHMFEQLGFARVGQLGKNDWLLRRVVSPTIKKDY